MLNYRSGIVTFQQLQCSVGSIKAGSVNVGFWDFNKGGDRFCKGTWCNIELL